MNSKKIYLYSGLSILGALAIYGYVSYNKKRQIQKAQAESFEENQEQEEQTVVTTTGSEISLNQASVPKELDEILKLSSKVATKALLNKNMFTKIGNVNVRLENYVNNGFINNTFGKIASSDVNVGKVIQVVDDKQGLKNAQGRVYKWFKIKPSQASIDAINKNKEFLQANRMLTPNLALYYREDTLKF